MKKTITLIFVLLFFSSFAQKKTYPLKLDEKKIVDRIHYTDNGNIFIITYKPTKLPGQKQHKTLTKISADFKESFKIMLKKTVYRYGMATVMYLLKSEVSPNGEYILIGDWLYDDKGQAIFNNFKKSQSGNVNKRIEFLSNKYTTYLGNFKKEKNKNAIFSRTNEGQKISENLIEDFNVQTNHKKTKKIYWLLKEIYDDSLQLTARDEVNKNKTIDVYHLLTIDYNGKKKSYTKLTVNLGSDHLIYANKKGSTSFYYHPGFGLAFSTSNIFRDKKTNNYYVYGFYTDKASKNMNTQKYLGYFIHKYDKNGNLIWNNKYSLENYKEFDKKIKPSGINISLNKLNDKENHIRIYLIDGFSKRKFFLSNVSSESGETSFNKIVKSKVKINSSYTSKKKMIGQQFARFIIEKDYPKKFFNLEAITAVNINLEVSNFIKNRKSDNNLYYEAKILENNTIILAEHNIKENEVIIYKF